MLKCGTEIIDLVVLGRNYCSSCRVRLGMGEGVDFQAARGAANTSL